jgi:hypothetical protein
MSLLWSTTTSRILLNGEAGQPIKHGRGRHQGNPLSPILFILVIDPLQTILHKATQQGLLHPIGDDTIKIRTSLFADNTALFLRPLAIDVTHFQQLLQSFGNGTGLCTNVHKSQVFPIRCEGTDLPVILGPFQAILATFPCRYLGLLLRTRRIRREDEQILIDKVAAKLPSWKGRLLNQAGQLTLINSVLSSIVIHHMSVFQRSKWAIQKIDKIRQAFLWCGLENARSGHYKVNWKRVQRPKQLGGLGILELGRFNSALRLRWQWMTWENNNKPWSGIVIPSSSTKPALFRACIKITIRNDTSTSFWDNQWLQGKASRQLAPALHKLAWRKQISMAQACREG